MSPGNEDRRPRAEAAQSSQKTTKAHATAPREPSAWLRAAVNRRVAQIRALDLDLTGIGAIVAPLGKPGRPGEPSDRECDRCGHITPVGQLFYPLMIQPLPSLHLFGGLCSTCHRREMAA